MESSHIISQDITLLEALARINTFKVPEPLVLFVVDDQQRMVGTLTDGDSRRALIAGASVTDKAEKVMHRSMKNIILWISSIWRNTEPVCLLMPSSWLEVKVSVCVR